MPQVVTFTSYKNDGTTQQGTPFILKTDNISGGNFNTAYKSSTDVPLPPPPPPPISNGDPDPLQYVSTGLIYADTTRIMSYTMHDVGPNDQSSSAVRSIPLKVFNKDETHVYWKYSESNFDAAFETIVIDCNNGTTLNLKTGSIVGSNTGVTWSSISGETKFSLPRMISATATAYTMNVYTQTNLFPSPTGITPTTASIPENTATNTEITTFTTIYADPTNALNGINPVYTFETGSNSEGYFQIAGDKLKTVLNISYEPTTEVTLGIKVTDSNNKFVTQNVIITVTDVNEEGTDVVLTLVGATLTTDSINNKVGDLSMVGDPDTTSAFTTYTYSVTEGGTNFEIINDNQLWTTAATLTSPSMTVIVKSNDGVNDVSTQFTVLFDPVALAPNGITFGVATPKTIDENFSGLLTSITGTTYAEANSANGTIFTYTLENNPGNHFKIDNATNTTANIITNDTYPINYETTPPTTNILLGVKSEDNNGKTITVNYSVNVGDVNEPGDGVILTLVSGATLTTDSINTKVGDLSPLNDPDSGNTFMYTIVGDGAQFEIKEYTQLWTKDNILTTSMTVTVNVYDGLNNRSTSFTVLFDPVALAPNGITFFDATSKTINENFSGLLTNITGTTYAEANSANGTSFTYTLENNPGNHFKIVSNTEIRTDVNINYETPTTQIILGVKSLDNNGKTITVNYSVFVTDVNEPGTSVSLGNITSDLTTNSKDVKVGELSTLGDPDTTLAFTTYTYTVTTGGTDFEVIGNELWTKAEATLTSTSAMSVIVKSTDGPHEVSAEILISFAQYNAPPTAVAFAPVSPLTVDSTGSVGTLSTTDADSTIFTYEIKAGFGSDTFEIVVAEVHIKSEAGTLTAVTPYPFTVISTDDSGNSVESSGFSVTFSAAASGDVTQTISLVTGWTWSSFYVDLTNTTLLNLSIENLGGCMIKAKVGDPASATYYATSNFTGWYPTYLDSIVWKNGVSFQINNPNENSASISLTNTVPSTINLTLLSGWNWIGFINSEEKTIVDVIPNGKAGYFIKRKAGNIASATYYVTSNFTGWYPANLAIIPGEGYQFSIETDEIITLSN